MCHTILALLFLNHYMMTKVHSFYNILIIIWFKKTVTLLNVNAGSYLINVHLDPRFIYSSALAAWLKRCFIKMIDKLVENKIEK